MQDHTSTDTAAADPAWVRARQRARSQRELYGHLLVYGVVSVLLIVIDVAGGSGLDWAFWPIGGWGIGVLLHVFRVFGPGTRWEERKASQLYQDERDRRSRTS